ncbi:MULTISPECIES: hypothetical protein [Burkholderia]|uniref:hypothetical protein n=1 Tax=Burkholderia TaxID=32008 RepID=UPI000C007D52|nr:MULTISPECIES: hypothetical protein [Burkholderia]PFH21008.1 hypothetical protein BX604_5433 [Burkholderia sp. JKS000303]
MRIRHACPWAGRAGTAQAGQAMVEILVIGGGVLLAAFLALSMLGHLSDARDRALMGSRYAAWERTVYLDDSGWHAPGGAATKTDTQIRSEMAQRVLGHGTRLTGADGARGALSSTPEPMWRDVAGRDMLRSYDDIAVSHVAGTTGTAVDKSMSMLDTLSDIGAGFDLPVKNQENARVSVRLAYDNPTLSSLWPSWQGLTFSDNTAILTNGWTADGSDHAKTLIAGAVPTAKGDLIGVGLDAFAPLGSDILGLKLGKIEPDVVPQDRLGGR